MKSVTIKDIAKMCGVGVSTVSRAINDKPGISAETKEKILKVIEESNYVPNNSARNLKRSENEIIAVLVQGINNSFFNPIISEFEKFIQEKNYTFILQQIDEYKDEVSVALELEKEKKLKGIVFLGGMFHKSKTKLDKISVPFVLCTVSAPEGKNFRGVPSVSVDDEKESFKIVDYLCSLGHKNIAIFSSTEVDEGIGYHRMQGYKKALKKNNIAYFNTNVYNLLDGNERYSEKSGYITAKKMLKSESKCTAIFAVNDSVAIGACRAIYEAGFNVPGDYSVVGYDGLDISRYYIPSITTIRQPVEEMAKAALKILFKMINGEESINQNIIFPGQLIIGESTRSI